MIALFFARVLFGGMLLGYVMGKICSDWLSKIFNDAVAETIITIAFPYITYFVGKWMSNQLSMLHVHTDARKHMYTCI